MPAPTVVMSGVGTPILVQNGGDGVGPFLGEVALIGIGAPGGGHAGHDDAVWSGGDLTRVNLQDVLRRSGIPERGETRLEADRTGVGQNDVVTRCRRWRIARTGHRYEAHLESAQRCAGVLRVDRVRAGGAGAGRDRRPDRLEVGELGRAETLLRCGGPADAVEDHVIAGQHGEVAGRLDVPRDVVRFRVDEVTLREVERSDRGQSGVEHDDGSAGGHRMGCHVERGEQIGFRSLRPGLLDTRGNSVQMAGQLP